MKTMVMIAWAGAACLLGGCMPSSLTFNFGPADQRLRETTVIDESATPKVALIDVRGLIVDGPQESGGLFGGGPNPVDELVARLEKAEKDGDVKAVILRINSPGGSVSASDMMFREVRRFAEKTHKPVVASLGEVAASGGYYLALSADEIIAQPTTITASIGVIIPTLNFSEGLKKIGIVSRAVKSGVNKDLASPLEPVREGQYAVLQTLVDEFYGRFKGLVVERRGSAGGAPAGVARRELDRSRLDELTDGRVVTGVEAVKAGLADREGDVRDAFERAKTLAGLRLAQLVKYHTNDSPRPRTAYALEQAQARGLDSQPKTEVNLLNIDLGPGRLPPGNAYYLWTAGAP
jgi:protease-4